MSWLENEKPTSWGDADSVHAVEAAVASGQPPRAVAAYARWWQLETWLRELAYVELRARHGVQWVDKVKAALPRQATDEAFTHMTSKDLANPLAYLDYKQLVQLMDREWDSFGYALLSKSTWDGRQEELGQIRHRIGHLRRPHTDDLGRLEQTLRDLERGAFLACSAYNRTRTLTADQFSDPVTEGWIKGTHPVAQRLIGHAWRQYETSLELTYTLRPWAEPLPADGPNGHPGALWHARIHIGSHRRFNIAAFWRDLVESRAYPPLFHMLVDGAWDATFTFAAVEGGDVVADAIGSVFDHILMNSRRVEELVSSAEADRLLGAARELDYRLLVNSRWNLVSEDTVPITLFDSGGGTTVSIRP